MNLRKVSSAVNLSLFANIYCNIISHIKEVRRYLFFRNLSDM